MPRHVHRVSVKRNITANFVGASWTALMSLVFIPVYIRYLGVEAYGLIGVFATLMAVFGLLDMGLSNTLNREMARLSVRVDKAREMRDLVRTLEIPYWVVGLLIGAIVIVLSQFIAHRWVNAEGLSPKTVQTAIIIMGLAAAFQWPISFYSGGLMGLERQVLLSGINVVMATFRGLGALLILWLVSPTVEAFFSWQIAVSLVNVSLIAFFLWRSLPQAAERPRLRRDLLRNIRGFAAGMTGISVLATILTQLDKVILSRILTLEMFGYYTLASVVAVTLSRFVGPVFAATYPRLTNLVTLGATEELTKLYHKSAQLVAVLVLPPSLVVALFSREILRLWTQSPVVVQHTHVLVSILVMGTAFNGLMNLPYALQLATGWTGLALLTNVVSALILVPLMIVLAKWYGGVGAASVWVVLNAGYVLFTIPIMHRRLLPTEKWRWYFQDVGQPFAVAALVAGALRLTIPIPDSRLALATSIVMVFAATMGTAALATPVARHWIRGQATL